MRPTKKAFEEFLNQTVANGHANNGWGNGSGAKTRPYGSWLRDADRDQFNDLFDGRHCGTVCKESDCSTHAWHRKNGLL